MTTKKNKAVWAFVKVAVAGASIWLIAGAFLSLNPKGQVKDAEADVWQFDMFRQSPNKRFARALEKLGHEPPRVYDNNGNTVFFATRTTRKRPDELVLEYQQAFVNEGVNREVHLSTPNQVVHAGHQKQGEFIDTRKDDLLTGEVLPFNSTENYMMMGGGLMRGAPVNKEELSRQMDNMARQNMGAVLDQMTYVLEQCGVADQSDLDQRAEEAGNSMEGDEAGCAATGTCSADMVTAKRGQAKMAALKSLLTQNRDKLQKCPFFREALYGSAGEMGFDSQLAGFRSIEAFRDPETGSTSVTAVWTDDGFDARQAVPEKYGINPNIEDDLVRCEDCQTTWTFGGNGSEEGYGTTLMFSNREIDVVANEYKQKLEGKGWKRAEGDIVMEKIYQRAGNPMPDKRALRFTKNGEHLRVMIGKDQHERTNVTMTRSPL